jgi:hypothetical protein
LRPAGEACILRFTFSEDQAPAQYFYLALEGNNQDWQQNGSGRIDRPPFCCQFFCPPFPEKAVTLQTPRDHVHPGSLQVFSMEIGVTIYVRA